MIFQAIYALNNCNRTGRYSEISGNQCQERLQLRAFSLSYLLMVLTVSEATAAHWIDDNGDYGILNSALSIYESSWFFVCLHQLISSFLKITFFFIIITNFNI